MKRIKRERKKRKDEPEVCVTPHPELDDMIKAHAERVAKELRQVERLIPENAAAPPAFGLS